MHIKNQIAVISGGASGMGAATARYLAKAGAKVAILDRNFAAAQQLADELNGIAVGADVTQSESITQAMAEIENQLGIPRICINCAGIAPGKLIVSKDATPMPLADFSQVIEINLMGTFNLLRVAAARMSTLEPISDNEKHDSEQHDSQERGVIINTASVAAYEGQIGQAAYSASKGGVVAMTLPAARELARYGIRVMTIAPGLIDTPLLRGLPDNVRESLAETVPFPKRFGDPAEYAQLVAHIVENTMLNGSVIRLDGALRMAPK
jgi:NAD(P)-dependent dehydrogenase (short-subunit alcohol dehydrogenase family)